MKSNELHDLFREDVQDLVAPQLWSPLEVYAYMNDAYFMFVRLTGGIPDTSSDFCTITATAGEPTTDLDPSILMLRTANLIAPDNVKGRAVRIINAQDTTNLLDEDYGVLRNIGARTTPGTVRYLIIGEEDDKVSWVNIPNENFQVKLLVERLPTKPITKEGQKFEGVKDHHHLHFLEWMKHRAYLKQDAETFNKAKSDECKATFEAYCAFARAEKDRYKHKVRVVAYGGL